MRRSWTWGPPALLALSIIWLSHQPQLPGGVSLPSPLDKVVHGAVYACLAWLLDLAFRINLHRWPMYRRQGAVLLSLLLFAISDEWHQSLVPGRDASVWDGVADVLGGLVGLGFGCLPFLLGSRDPSFGWWRGCRRRRDPARPLVLVADPHWAEELTGLREMTRKYPEADWLFLGDIFDVWSGIRGMENEAQRSFLWWVQDRRVAGCWIGLWMGNRDYFLDRFSDRFDLVGEGTGGGLPEEGLGFEHGDLVNTADRPYRFWNLVSRSAAMWLGMALLPSRWAQKVAQRLEASMRTRNKAYRIAFPREAFGAAAAEREGTWITGHFHSHEEEGRGVAIPWAHEGAFALWHQGRVELLEAPLRSDPSQLDLKGP